MIISAGLKSIVIPFLDGNTFRQVILCFTGDLEINFVDFL